MIKPAVSQPRADRALTPALSRNGRGSEAEILMTYLSRIVFFTAVY
jgi:hypothetical protein